MTAPAEFGRLARSYRWIEYLSFGFYLKQCRELRINEMLRCNRALVYGDGDGRFLAKLTRRAPRMQITAVDASSQMLRQAGFRLPADAQVHLFHADALAFLSDEVAEHPFDLVISHFFLDCFDEDQLTSLMNRVAAATSAGTIWVVSDFAIPKHPAVRVFGIAIIRSLYFAFGLLTGLKTRRLPDHARVMRDAGWVLDDERRLLFGLLISQRWRRGV